MNINTEFPPDMLSFDDIEIGRSRTLVHTMSETEVNAFGRLCGDLNPLHMNEAFAARSAFGARVVHGMLSAALISATHTALTGPGFVYVGQDLNFSAPVFIGDTITINVTVVEKKPAKKILVMDTIVHNQNGKAVLSGRSALKELPLV